MNTREKYGMAFLIIAIFLFQIWVADAETQLKKEPEIKDFSTRTLKVMQKILGSKELSKKIGIESQEKVESSEKEETTDKVKKVLKKKKEEAGFVWYKPWTWFGQ